jgi:hypothetical protein
MEVAQEEVRLDEAWLSFFRHQFGSECKQTRDRKESPIGTLRTNSKRPTLPENLEPEECANQTN